MKRRFMMLFCVMALTLIFTVPADAIFCNKCGTHLFYRRKKNNAHQMLVGQFDEQENFHFDLQVYMDSKPAFYDFANKTRELTEAEVIAEFGPGQDT